MRSVLFAPSKSGKLKPLKLKPVEGFTFVDSGVGGKPHPDAMNKLNAFWAAHPRKLRKGEKGAAELLKESRDHRR